MGTSSTIYFVRVHALFVTFGDEMANFLPGPLHQKMTESTTGPEWGRVDWGSGTVCRQCPSLMAV